MAYGQEQIIITHILEDGIGIKLRVMVHIHGQMVSTIFNY